jgi:hypothetical protein
MPSLHLRAYPCVTALSNRLTALLASHQVALGVDYTALAVKLAVRPLWPWPSCMFAGTCGTVCCSAI